MKRIYSSTKLGFTIHRPSVMHPVLHGGREVFDKQDLPPIEFKDGRYETADENIQKLLKDHASYGRDFVDATEVIDTAERAEGKVKAALKKITDISNKNQAIQALVGNGVDPAEWDRTTNKAAMKQIAESHGFTFSDW